MKFFWLWMFGFLTGILVAYIEIVFRRRSNSLKSRDQCKHVTQRISGDSVFGIERLNSMRCETVRSNLCVDGLCPVHCKEVHGTRCMENWVK